MSANASHGSTSGEETSIDPVVVYKTLKIQQSVFFAIVAGLIGTLTGGACLALLSIVLGFKFGIFSIAIGILAGALINALGAGYPKYFGLIAIVFTTLGYIFGNACYQIYLIALQESLSFFEVVPFLNEESIKHMLRDCAHVVDIIYMCAAMVPAYHLSTRSLTEDIIKNAAHGKVSPDRYASYRIPALALLVVATASLAYYVSTLTTIDKTYYYDSGAKKSSGQLSHGKENGTWTFWYERGKVEYTGQYDLGKMVGEWHFFRNDGSLDRIDHYLNGKLNGETIEYYSDGSIRTKSVYKNGFRNGSWEMFYESEKLLQKGMMVNGRAEGLWETYYENGQKSSSGTFIHNEPRGAWTYWSEAGVKAQESLYESDGTLKLINSWDAKGKPVIVNGRGKLLVVNDKNMILESGAIERGVRVGRWEKRFGNGVKIEVGEYRDGKYSVTSAWTPKGETIVMLGDGFHKTFYPNSGAVLDSGLVEDGLRQEKWMTFYERGKHPKQKTYFVKGVEHGTQTNYFDNGFVSSEGEVKSGKRDGEWTWYTRLQTKESKVTYVNGLKEGRQEYYGVDEKLIRWEDYKAGRIVAEQIVN